MQSLKDMVYRGMHSPKSCSCSCFRRVLCPSGSAVSAGAAQEVLHVLVRRMEQGSPKTC